MGEEDVRHGAERLRKLLRTAQYPQLSALRLEDGNVSDLLRVLHFVLLDSSRCIAQFLLDRGYDLYGKTDVRFVESTFRLLRDDFQCFPSLSVAQFLSRQFVARKLSIVADAAAAVAKKHQELQKQKRREEIGWSQPHMTSRMQKIKTKVENHLLPGSVTNHAANIMQHLKVHQSQAPRRRRSLVQNYQVEQGTKATRPLVDVAVQCALESASHEVSSSKVASVDSNMGRNFDQLMADLTRQVNEMSSAVMDKLSSVENRLGRLEDQLHGVKAAVNEQHQLVREVGVQLNKWGSDSVSQGDVKMSKHGGLARRLDVESPCTWPPQPSVFERY